MGMYDTLFINKQLLPLSEEDKAKIPEGQDWQTKDLDCMLDILVIANDGQLIIASRKSWGSWKRAKTYHDEEQGVKSDYSGTINFYTDIQDQWFEFEAIFVDGKLRSITRFYDHGF